MTLQTIVWTIVTIVLWGVIPIFDKLALSQAAVSPLVGIAIRSFSVMLLAVPMALAVDKGAQSLKAIPGTAVALYVASGVTSLLLAQYSYYTLLRQAEISRVFPFLFSAAPVVTMVIGVFGLGETISTKQVVGAALVIGGGLLLL